VAVSTFASRSWAELLPENKRMKLVKRNRRINILDFSD